MHRFISGLSIPLIYVFIFMPIPYCFNYYSFIIQFEIRKYDFSSFVLSQVCFSYLGSLVVSYKFQNCSSVSLKICHWNFGMDYNESVDDLGQYEHFNNILPVHEHEISFHLFMFSISFISVLYFSVSRSVTYLVKFIPRVSLLFLMQL